MVILVRHARPALKPLVWCRRRVAGRRTAIGNKETMRHDAKVEQWHKRTLEDTKLPRIAFVTRAEREGGLTKSDQQLRLVRRESLRRVEILAGSSCGHLVGWLPNVSHVKTHILRELMWR